MDGSMLTVKKLAELTGESRLTWWRRIKAGVLPSFKMGRNRRVAASDFRAFLEGCREESTATRKGVPASEGGSDRSERHG